MKAIIIILLFALTALSSGFNCQDYSINTKTGSSGDKPVPEAPINLAATIIQETQINLSWTDNSNVEQGFKIERKTLTTQYSLLTTVSENVTSYSDTGVIDGTAYYYRVCAYNKSGDSDYSNEASSVIELNAPTLLTLTVISSTRIDLSWTDNSNNELGFKIERKVDAGGTYEQIATTATDVVIYSDTTVTQSNTYYYKVKAFKGDEDSSYSPEAYITLDVPIAYWKFDETSGITATDSSGNGNDGTVYGATWSSGTLSFDGVNDYVDAGNSPTLKITGQMTVQAWFKTTISGTGMVIVSNYDCYGPLFPANNKKGYILFLNSSGTIYFDIYKYQSVDTYDSAETNNAFNDGKWHQAVGVFPANGVDRIQIYVDGNLQSVTRYGSAKTDCTASTVNLNIGREGPSNYGSAGGYFNGQIDDVKIYNYARTAEDILSDYSADNTHGLIAWWNFDETSGITATDSSDNGNDGTVYGATWSSGTLSFDGVNDYVDAGNSPTLKITGQMTVQAWFKTVISGTWMTIVGNYDCYGPLFPDNNKKGYSLHLNSDGKILFDIYKYQSADVYDSAETNNVFNDGNWHQAVGVFPANGIDRVQIYVDGNLQSVTRVGSAKTDCTASTVNLMIGRVGPSNYQSDANYFNGQLDDVKIYNYARSAGDILSYYNSYKPTMLANTPWPIFQHDNRHSGLSLYTGSAISPLKWTYTTGNVIEYPAPVIGADGTIYIGSRDCKLHAVNPNGTIKWSYITAGWVCGSATIIADGTLYVGSADKKLHAINPNGTVKWTYLTGGSVGSSPAIATDGTIYVGTGSGDNKLYAINPNGSLKWTYPAGYIDVSAAIGADGTIYIGSENSKLYAINPDGSLKWDYTLGNVVHASPSIGADGTIYVGCYDSKLYAINPDGSLKWTYATGDNMCSAAAIGPDGTIYVGCYDNKLYAINPDGSFKWSYTTGGSISSSPAIGADGVIYVGSADNKIYAVNSNCTLKWSYTTGNFVDSSPSIGADGTIYVGSRDGKLYAIGP